MTLQPTIKIVLDIELYAVVKSHCKEQGQMSQLVRKLLREYFNEEPLIEEAKYQECWICNNRWQGKSEDKCPNCGKLKRWD